MTTDEIRKPLKIALKSLKDFNKFDSPFAQKMANTPTEEWTPNQTRLVYLMVQRYEEQLEKLGIDWEKIITPDHVSKDKLDNYPRVIFYDNNKLYGYDKITGKDKITVKIPTDDVPLFSKFMSMLGREKKASPRGAIPTKRAAHNPVCLLLNNNSPPPYAVKAKPNPTSKEIMEHFFILPYLIFP